MSAPSIDQASHEMQAAESAMNFNAPEWTVFEEWLSWRRYKIAMQVLAVSDDDLRVKMHGMATNCTEIIKMIEAGRIAKSKNL